MEKKNNRGILTLLTVFFALLFCVSAGMLIKNKLDAARTKKHLDNAAQEIQRQLDLLLENKPSAPDQNPEDGTDEETKPAPDIYSGLQPLDLSFLTEQNPEIIGWLTVSGTNINYPLLYASSDNSFYLNHNFLKNYDYEGSVFIENYNSSDLSDFNTVIYGHALLNGRMFAQIHNFADPSFFDSNDTITIYLKDRVLIYKIFCCETISDTHILSGLNNYDPASCKAYLDGIFSRQDPNANIRSMEITENNKIITLATCKTDKSKRLVIHAVLVE